MKIIPIFIAIILTITLLLPQGCTNDTLVDNFMCDENDNFTYENEVRDILRRTCATGGICHNPSGTSPNYESLNDAMLTSLTPERFENRVIKEQSMPPAGFPQLDSLENYIIRCWIESGYPIE